MVTYRGYQTNVQYGAETSYGAGGSAVTAIKGRIQTVTINQSNSLIRVAALGEGRNETFVGFGNYSVEWSMEWYVGDPDFLEFGIGLKGGSGSTAAPYYLEEKEYIDYSTGLKSFAMAVGSEDVSATDDNDLITGCITNTIGLSCEVGGALTCSMSGFGKSVTSSTAAAAYTADTTRLWIFTQGAFKWNNSAVGRCKSFTININNNFDPDVARELGSRTIPEAAPGLRKYDWVAVVKMTDTVATTLRTAFYGKAAAVAPDAGVLDSEPTFYDLIFNFAEGAASTDKVLQVLLSNCAINDISKPVNIGENLVELTLNGTAKKGTTDTSNRPIKWYTVT